MPKHVLILRTSIHFLVLSIICRILGQISFHFLFLCYCLKNCNDRYKVGLSHPFVAHPILANKARQCSYLEIVRLKGHRDIASKITGGLSKLSSQENRNKLLMITEIRTLIFTLLPNKYHGNRGTLLTIGCYISCTILTDLHTLLMIKEVCPPLCHHIQSKYHNTCMHSARHTFYLTCTHNRAGNLLTENCHLTCSMISKERHSFYQLLLGW